MEILMSKDNEPLQAGRKRSHLSNAVRLAVMCASMCVLVATLTLVPISCFSTPTPDCAYLCGDGNGNSSPCPEGYYCADDGACKRVGVAETFDCGFVAPADAGRVIDAAPPDAAPPDAAPPDAAPPDAAPPDAAI